MYICIYAHSPPQCFLVIIFLAIIFFLSLQPVVSFSLLSHYTLFASSWFNLFHPVSPRLSLVTLSISLTFILFLKMLNIPARCWTAPNSADLGGCWMAFLISERDSLCVALLYVCPCASYTFFPPFFGVIWYSTLIHSPQVIFSLPPPTQPPFLFSPLLFHCSSFISLCGNLICLTLSKSAQFSLIPTLHNLWGNLVCGGSIPSMQLC